MLSYFCETAFVLSIIICYSCQSKTNPVVTKKFIAKQNSNLVIDCKFKDNASESLVHNVRLSSDESNILAYLKGKEKILFTGNYQSLAAKLTMSVERRAANHMRIYFEQIPRSLNNVSVICRTTDEGGLGRHRMTIRNVIYMMQAPSILDGTFPERIELRENELARPEVICKATALPTPVVEWYSPRQRRLASTEEDSRREEMRGAPVTRSLRLPLQPGPVTRRWAGVYRCEARFSTEDQRRVSLNPVAIKDVLLDVLFKPRVAVTERIVYTDVGASESVQIDVDANPKANVSCALLDIPEPRLLAVSVPDKTSTSYRMRLLRVRAQDAGEYLCNASNSLGSASAKFVLSITPPPPVIVSPVTRRTEFSDYYHLRGQVNSKAALRNVTVSLRMRQNGTMVTLRNETQFLGGRRRGAFTLHLINLTHNTEHEAVARVCSSHACSPYSPGHRFHTRWDADGRYTAHPSVYRVQAVSAGENRNGRGAASRLFPPRLLGLLLWSAALMNPHRV